MLLLSVTIADLERFTPKDKPVIYTGAFVELYNQRNGGQIYEIHGMIEFEKMRASTVENPCNLNAHQIIEISLVLCNVHVVSRDQDKFVFYINNYIDWDQFNQLYNPNWMEKDIRNTDTVAHKLRPASTRATNDKLKAAKEERQKRKEMIERQKAKAMVAKWCKARGGISSSSKKEDESDTGDDTDLDQADDKYLMQL